MKGPVVPACLFHVQLTRVVEQVGQRPVVDTESGQQWTDSAEMTEGLRVGSGLPSVEVQAVGAVLEAPCTGRGPWPANVVTV